MNSTAVQMPPPDSAEREQALDAKRSVLVEAPAGSGKTDLLTRRCLRLLAEVDEPGQIVAITFTKAAAAEMRHRILKELENAARCNFAEVLESDLSMETLARRALVRSRELGWNLTELPAQLRISTIDAFCRDLALQQPLLTDLSSGLDIFEEPNELYRRAARKTLEQIDDARPELRAVLERLLLWRDNSWQEMENLLIKMLARRDRWMQGFVFDPEQDDDILRSRLERPFARAVRARLEELSDLLDRVPHAREEALQLARFGCANTAGALHRELAEMAEFPTAPFVAAGALEEGREAFVCLGGLLLTKDGTFRQRIDKSLGFPADRKKEKERLTALIADLRGVPGLDSALAAIGNLPPAQYAEEDWQIVRACFVLLKQAAAQLKVAFAEAGAVDYTEVAQIAMQVLRNPGEGTLAIADGIRHLLVDEFQDTSRRQHQLLERLIAAWPEREGRTCFMVGDPMQSIYFFRDADAELFPQVRDKGLLIPDDLPFGFDHVLLKTNFRTAQSLVERLNGLFEAVFAADDGSGVLFRPSESPQSGVTGPVPVERDTRLHLHFEYMPATWLGRNNSPENSERVRAERVAAHRAQIEEIVELIRSHKDRMAAAHKQGKKYRIAVLGRAHTVLTPIAEALRRERIPFRAIELERLMKRPEVKDALAIARALVNPHDRIAWLGLLRAPWCGLSLADLHALASADDAELKKRPVRELIAQRAGLLTEPGRAALARVLQAFEAAEAWRAARPGTALGTWIEQAWVQLGGECAVDEAARANVELLWGCLDRLPEGDADVTGAALDASLDKLTALPDPRADADCGVQLLTIHKAKGLEFEVVIVPELQASGGRKVTELLAWFERGLPVPDDDGDVTEFLVAPIPPKGADRGKAKTWVDREYRNREKQETRRILYVAATRAREELHFFARPEYKIDANGNMNLTEPKESLLQTAWPALGDEARRKFEDWTANREAAGGEVTTIAAVADSLFEMSAVAKPAVLRRLPSEYISPKPNDRGTVGNSVSGTGADRLYTRHEGGRHSRALGIAVHAVFEDLARLRETKDWESARIEAEKTAPQLTSVVRATGIDLAQAKRIATGAVEIALDASRDAIAQWILSPRSEAASEARWASASGSDIYEVRVDRVFRAGPEPGSEGCETWWIIDYKTAHADGLDPEGGLSELRKLFAPQLEAYARVLRGLHGEDAAIRAGLYYPRMKKFDWWVMQ